MTHSSFRHHNKYEYAQLTKSTSIFFLIMAYYDGIDLSPVSYLCLQAI
jgi:hypothetical protein